MAALASIASPAYFVEQNYLRLVSAPVAEGSDAQAVAQVYAWAADQHAQELAKLKAAQEELDAKKAALLDPGADPARVGDDKIAYALEHVRAALKHTPPTEAGAGTPTA